MECKAVTNVAVKVLDNAGRPELAIAPTANGVSCDSTGALQRDQLTGYAGVKPLAKTVEQSVRPGDALEAMLCDQLSAAHNAGMRLIAKASVADSVEPMIKLTLAAARMMASFQDGLLVLKRIRNAEPQPAVVQHVNVGEGGRAVVAGNINHHGDAPSE